MRIAKDCVVTIDYTLTNPQGQVIDTSKGREPLAYLHGAGGIIPGLEKALEGRSAGDRIDVSVSPEQGYGLRDDAMVRDVPRASFRGVTEITPGTQFQANTPNGARIVTVVAVEADKVRVDANHPLAGVTLRFDVTVVDVREATQEELDHRHAHGPEGHPHGGA